MNGILRAAPTRAGSRPLPPRIGRAGEREISWIRSLDFLDTGREFKVKPDARPGSKFQRTHNAGIFPAALPMTSLRLFNRVNYLLTLHQFAPAVQEW